MTKSMYVLLTLISVSIYSCQKAAISTPLPSLNFADSSETLQALDSTSFGVYKGVVAGKNGRIKIYFANGDTILKAYLSVDSLSDTLTCDQRFTLGSAIPFAAFTGRRTFFTFSADEQGENTMIENITIDNRFNYEGAVAHEKSNQLVYCYEAAFTGNERGYFNFLTAGSKALGVAKTTTGDLFKGEGLFTGNIFSIVLNSSTTSNSTFEGGVDATRDYLSGTWQKSAASSGSFSGQRTQ